MDEMVLVPSARNSCMCNPKAHNQAGWHETELPVSPTLREFNTWARGYNKGYRNGRDAEAERHKPEVINF